MLVGLARAPAVILLVVALLLLPARPATAQKGLDLQATVFTDGSGSDTLAVAYGTKPTDEQIQQDFAGLAGGASPKLKITRDAGITVAEGKITSLANWQTGVVNLDPLIQTFKRFGYFQLSFFFFGNFPIGELKNIQTGPVKVVPEQHGNAVNYRVWMDQSRGVPQQVPSVTNAKSQQGIPIAALVGISVGLILSVALIVLGLLNRRRSGAPAGPVGEGKV